MVSSSRTNHGLMGKSRGLLFTMATRTPRTASHGSTLTVIWFLLRYIGPICSQQYVFPFKAPSDCSAEEFFDISSLSCGRCGADQRQSTTGQCMQVTLARNGISGLSTDSKLIVSVFTMTKFKRGEDHLQGCSTPMSDFGWVPPDFRNIVNAFRPLRTAIQWE